MQDHAISGGCGLKLHVVETGKPTGKPILFIHGFSQSGLAWNKQLRSDLAEDFHLVSMDLRGHGLSGKDRDVYGDPKLWADDVHAVIETLALTSPVVVGWSYAGLVITDYVTHYGEGQIAGTNWVGALSRLGKPLVAPGFLGADFLECVPGFVSDNVEESAMALQKFVRCCVYAELSPEDLHFLLGCTTVVPPYVRQGLISRNVNNDSVIEGMRKPMLFTYGEEDRIALKAMRDHMVKLAQQAKSKLSLYSKIGHAPFWEAPGRFNMELRQFRESV
jgi:pimeloyl-ACP methyl ester carboxylesterase